APKGNYLFALQRNGTLLLVKFDDRSETTFAPVARLARGGVVGAHFSPDAKALYFAIHSGEVAGFDTERKTLARPSWRLPTPATPLALGRDGQRLAVATYDAGASQAAIHVWDLATDAKHLQALEWPGAVKAMAFSPDGRQLASSVVVENRGKLRGQL